jgi:hypothetical protein
MRRRASNPKITWAAFGAQVADLPRLLEDLSVVVRPAGNTASEYVELEEKAEKALLELSDDPEVGGSRSRQAAAADAASLTMVARWRRQAEKEHCAAYFVANDALTGHAHKLVVPEDGERLVVNAAGWVMYMAAATTDDPAQRANLAQLVSHAVVRERVLGMATAYTIEEALQLSQILEENGAISASDVRATLQLDLDQLHAEADATADRATLAAGEVLRRRSQRRDDRARRREQLAAAAEDDAQRRISEAQRVAADAERVRVESLQKVTEYATGVTDAITAKEAAERDVSSAEGREKKANDEVRRLRRILLVVIVGVLLGIAAAALVSTGHLTGAYRVGAALAGVIYVIGAINYCRNLKRTLWDVVAAAVVGACLLALELVLGSTPSSP